MRFFIFSVLLLTVAINVTFACECGTEGSVTRIFKGTKARAHKYPWLAYIRTFPSRKSLSFTQCGGALIDEKHVITAAHCVVDDFGRVASPSNIDVFLGRVKSAKEPIKAGSVSAVWADPNYEQSQLTNDFAILTLSNAFVFTQSIAPVCLPNNEDNLSKLIVAGWGITSDDDPASDDLLEVEVDFINKKDCNEIKKDYAMRLNGFPSFMRNHVSIEGVPETQMCAINKETKGTSCKGDSGGPLMHKGDNGRYYAMGVVSGSWHGCGETKNAIGLYTRVNIYKDKIKSIAPNACWQD